MITVLWVMTVASIMAMAAALAGRNAVNATRNRTHLDRALWVATGCAERARAAIDDRLGESTYEDAGVAWRVLDRVVLPIAVPDGDDCRIALEAAGSTLDVNTASDAMLDSLFHTMGSSDDAATTMVSALADWRVRNGDVVDLRQLEDLPGFTDVARYDSVLSAESGRVSLATAPVLVLRALPGITSETAERVAVLRDAGTPVSDPVTLVPSLSPPSADALMAHYADLVRVATADPDAWILTVAASSGLPASDVVLEWRLVRTGKRCVVVRTRSRP